MAKKREPLGEYQAKRDFGKTPEPPPAAVSGAAEETREGAFVIHRHEARNLHYDLRLEMEGVLKSWAVPKGFSYVSANKHLAVQTEDHPIEYLHFDGVIPKGEYGAGTMTIWDSGRFEIVGKVDGLRGLADGKLEFVLNGGRLRGQWHMVRLKTSERDWLLFKYRDRYAIPENESPFPLDLSREKRTKMPARVSVMACGETSSPFSAPEWLFELRFTGMRLVAFIDGETIRFGDAAGRRADVQLPRIEAALRKLRAERAVIDGVLVALDENGRPDPTRLAAALEGDGSGLSYYVFDLLYFDEWSLQKHTLLDRKRSLAAILPRSDVLLYVDHVMGRGDDLHRVVQSGGLSGVVAKDSRSRYRGGPSTDWREVLASADAPSDRSVLESLESAGRSVVSRVKISNPQKVYWPDEGITKGELIEYYDRMSDYVLPYLRDRPVHMLRYPDGIYGKFFYQKNVTGRIPDWVPTVLLNEEDGEEVRYVVCNDRDTLLHLVNLGSIDLHPWHSRVDDLESPDFAIIDLDPSEVNFAKVVRLAQTIGKILHGAGLRPLLKTSGATGMHVYVPLVRGYSYEQARMFCEIVARMTVREHKEIATVERVVAKRDTRVYVDFGQNRREQTIAPPYAVRPVPGATVSAPLDWDELTTRLHPSQFHLRNVPERVSRLGDLFRAALDDPQDLSEAIESLSR
jgi:bifunctional non-homologous end joining protein LigD